MAQKKPVTFEDLDLRNIMEARGEEAARVNEQARQAAMDFLRREDLID